MWPISAMYKFRYLIRKFLKIKTIIMLKYNKIKVKNGIFICTFKAINTKCDN